MKYKLRLVEMSNGKCRIQKRHWLLTFGFWWYCTCTYGLEYWEGSKEKALSEIKEYYDTINKKPISFKEIEND